MYTQFYYIKVGFKGVRILKVCFHDVDQEPDVQERTKLKGILIHKGS